LKRYGLLLLTAGLLTPAMARAQEPPTLELSARAFGGEWPPCNGESSVKTCNSQVTTKRKKER
jgi:hypothetical protein